MLDGYRATWQNEAKSIIDNARNISPLVWPLKWKRVREKGFPFVIRGSDIDVIVIGCDSFGQKCSRPHSCIYKHSC